MRIIAGIYKGRKLKVPNSKLVRPTTDKNKEAIFNYLYNSIDFDNILVADLYAGTGSLGLEALSRGAGEVHFVEKNFPIYKVLKENIDSINAGNISRIFKMSSLTFSKMSGHEKYDLILADPPFFKDDIHEVVSKLLRNGFLNEQGLLIVERSIQTEEKDLQNFGLKPIKRLGDSLIFQFSADNSEREK